MAERGPRDLGSVCQLVIDDLGGEDLRLEGEPARHLVRSLRARPGDRVEAVDGRGGRARLEVVACERDAAALRVLERRHEEPPPRRWWLATTADEARVDWLVEKAVELGAWGFVPLAGGGRRRPRPERWRRVARAALEQCRRSWALELAAPRDLAAALAGGGELPVWGAVVWADPAGRDPASVAAGLPAAGDLLLAVGPPEGLATAEKAALDAAGAVPLALGPGRLRSETAALAALAWARFSENGLFSPSGPG